MVKKKKKKEKEFSYYTKPTTKQLQRAYKKAHSPRAVKEVERLFTKQETNYETQRGKIAYGSLPSRNKAVLKKTINKLNNNLNKAGSIAVKNLLKKKILKKPQAKIQKYSAKKFISQLAENNQLIGEGVDYSNPPQDNRSLFFRESYLREKNKRFGGFI